MINIEYNGLKKSFNNNITGIEFIDLMFPNPVKDNIFLLYVNNQLEDLSITLHDGDIIKILSINDKESLNVIRHDAAHILAQAIKELFPKAKMAVGPVINDGFYYDFDTSAHAFSINDLTLIESRMHDIVARDIKICKEIWDKKKAIEYFSSINEHYKVEILESIEDSEIITVYRHNDFIDLCKGPHGPSTGKIKFFKLTKLSGVYWRNNAENVMLQRIYGTAWSTQKDLDQYLLQITELEKRDHRKIGKELDLFHFQEEAPGIPFWHSNGMNIMCAIEKYIRLKNKKFGYKEIRTPLLLSKKLWKMSGHWDKFREYMFTVNESNQELALKPMSCPGHIEIFKNSIKSYRDLPIRFSEFGCCHRNEFSGSLHGLMRVRSFVQDDGHVFCTEDQITNETIKFCNELVQIYNDFGFNNVQIKFADRPKNRSGEDFLWNKSELALKTALEKLNYNYDINSGEGAFYGPKLEFVIRDAIGRDWQCGTLQVDFVLPKLLGAYYMDNKNKKHHPVILHRAILGTFERFIGILIEQYSGKLPLWLAPIQVAILSISRSVDDYANYINNKLIDFDIRSVLDNDNENVNYKIRKFSLMKVPILVIIGNSEKTDSVITVRNLGSDYSQKMSINHLIDTVLSENSKFFKN